ncbi:MAG: anthrone oxygenase family protein, partial [Betaproteobacteria bacterium]
MTDRLVFALTLCAAIGCGLVAGVFYAFSTFVMRALSRIPPQAGIAAMQSINVAVFNLWFMGAFLGTAALCFATLIVSITRWQQPGSMCLLIGSVLYLAGNFLVTMLFNVPKNNTLAAVAPSEPSSGEVWVRYLPS